MRDRPLCTVCLVIILLICMGTVFGREKFVKELRPSGAELKCSEKDNITLVGKVYQKAYRQDYNILYLKNNSMKCHQQSLKESKIIIYDEKKQKINIGDFVVVRGKISFFQSARNPGNFDMKLYYQKQDIHASVWAVSIKKQKGNPYSLYEKVKNRLYDFRWDWKEKLCGVMGEKDGNILAAMILAEKSQMDTEVKELYQINGIGHILAISGLHLSLIGVGMYSLFRRISGSYVVGGVAGILFLSLYILMIGLTVSVLRAGIMFLFRIGADMTGRNYDSLTALTFAAVIVLIWQPLSIYDGGFWLSFGAVLAIIILVPAFGELPFQGFFASVSISFVTLPVLLYYFYEFPVYSVILNLYVIPSMSVLLLFGVTGSIFYCITDFLGVLALKLCKVILWIYEKSCHIAAGGERGRIVTGQPQKWQIAVYYICLVVALYVYSRQRRKGRKMRESIIPLCFLCVGILVLTIRFGEKGKLEVTVLDVGQGDGIFMRGPKGGTYFIDGGSSDVKQVGKYRIESFLKSRGVRKLDYVFISHSDSDHMNGISEMIERKEVGIEIGTLVFPVREVWDEKLIYLAEKAMEEKITVAVIEPEKVIKESGLQLSCVMPDREFEGESGNEASMVLAVSYEGFDMLLTGDTEEEGEEMLTERIKEDYEGEHFEVLKAAHHGSKNSSAEEFLKEVQPMYTIISAGQNNRYGHPHQETLDRLQSVGSKVYSTQDCGAITVEVGNGSFSIKCFVAGK